MNRAEIEAAIMTESPVCYVDPRDRQPLRDMTPRALIWRNAGKGKMVWQVELMDKCRRSVIICNPRNIKPANFGQKE